MNPLTEIYEIVKYRPEFKQQILELQTLLWSGDLAINAAYLDWKYLNNPYMNEPLIYLALSQGRVVGMRGMYGTCWQIGRSHRLVPWVSGADAIVHPAHRRRGLLERMTQLALENLTDSKYEYVVTLSANQISSSNNLKLGWFNVGLLETARRHAARRFSWRLSCMARQLPVLSTLYRNLRDRRSWGLSSSQAPFDALDKHGEQAQRCASPINIGFVPRPEAMAVLNDRLDNSERLHHVRDAEFFAWRYQNPLSTYRFLFRGDSKLEGYLVLQTRARPSGDRWVNIVDWEATSLQVRSELLHTAIKWGGFNVLNVWTATLSADVRNLLDTCGFQMPGTADASQKNLLIRGPDRPQANWCFASQRLFDMSNWDLRAIDSDDF